jgi:hypothetical protein
MCVWNATVLVLIFCIYIYTGKCILLKTLNFQAFQREIQMEILWGPNICGSKF